MVTIEAGPSRGCGRKSTIACAIKCAVRRPKSPPPRPRSWTVSWSRPPTTAASAATTRERRDGAKSCLILVSGDFGPDFRPVHYPGRCAGPRGARGSLHPLVYALARLQIIWADAGRLGELVAWVKSLRPFGRLHLEVVKRPEQRKRVSLRAKALDHRTHLRLAHKVSSSGARLRAQSQAFGSHDSHLYDWFDAPTIGKISQKVIFQTRSK